MRGPSSSYRPAVPSGLCSLGDVWLVWNPSIFRQHSSEPRARLGTFTRRSSSIEHLDKCSSFLMICGSLSTNQLRSSSLRAADEQRLQFAGYIVDYVKQRMLQAHVGIICSSCFGFERCVSSNSHTTDLYCCHYTSFPLFAEAVWSLLSSLCEVRQTDETGNSQILSFLGGGYQDYKCRTNNAKSASTTLPARLWQPANSNVRYVFNITYHTLSGWNKHATWLAIVLTHWLYPNNIVITWINP